MRGRSCHYFYEPVLVLFFLRVPLYKINFARGASNTVGRKAITEGSGAAGFGTSRQHHIDARV